MNVNAAKGDGARKEKKKPKAPPKPAPVRK